MSWWFEMTELYPLEGELERRLPEVDIELGRRISRDDLIKIARGEDEVDEMLGNEGQREEYGKVTRRELDMDPTEVMLYYIFKAGDLSETQRKVEEDWDLIFKRTSIRNPWSVTYDVHQYEGYQNVTERIDIRYKEIPSSLLFLVGRQDGYTDVTSYSKEIPQSLQGSIETLEILDRILPWNPELIVEEIVRLIERE